MPGGRPSKYAKIMTPEMLVMVEKFCKLGSATDENLAEFLSVHVSTVYEWKLNYEEFSEAIKRGKDYADMHVAEALYHRAIGYSHQEDKIFQYEGLPVVVPTVKHYPPDTAAAIIWLKNRRPQDWRQTPEMVNNNTIIKEVKVVSASDYKAQMEVSKKAS